ncbi:hypothetical protein WJX75_004281 [Coccomyxa subellipsoidea]|uniref:Uncharacterized protein n=1 Tax=Coccomyxa subellipsoidea TaxID=248742 RepID=A0ABR2YHA6_9CHLO
MLGKELPAIGQTGIYKADAIRSGSEGRIYIVQCTKTLSVVPLAKLFYGLQAFAQEMAKEPQLLTEENMPGTSNVQPLA